MLNTIFGIMPLKTERSGLIFAVLGAIMVILDPRALRVDGYQAPNSVYVSLLMSSIFGAAYLLFNDKQTKEFRICFLVFYQSLQMFILSTFTTMMLHSNQPDIFSTKATWGILGFLDSENFFDMVVLQGFLSGLCAGFGQSFCLFYHAPVLTQSVLLSVPFIAEGLAFVTEIDKPLDFLSFFGAIFALTGMFKIFKGDRQRRAMIIREHLLKEEEELRKQQLEVEMAEKKNDLLPPLE